MYRAAWRNQKEVNAKTLLMLSIQSVKVVEVLERLTKIQLLLDMGVDVMIRNMDNAIAVDLARYSLSQVFYGEENLKLLS